MPKRKPTIGRKSSRSAQPSNGGVGRLVLGLSVLFLLCAMGGLYFAPSKSPATPTPAAPRPTQDLKGLLSRRSRAQNDVEERIRTNILLFDYSTDESVFPASEVQWMIQSEEPQMQTRAAIILQSRGERLRARNLLERVIEKAPLPGEVSSVAFDTLSQIYREDQEWAQVARVLEKAVAMRTETTYLNRWFGFWLEALLTEGDHSSKEVQQVIRQCLKEFSNTPDVFPFHCYQQAGMQEMFEGHLAQSVQHFFTLYRGLLKNWADTSGAPCPATLVPLPFPELPESKALRDQVVWDDSWHPDMSKLTVPPPEGGCLDQEWPWALSDPVYDAGVPGQQRRDKIAYEEDVYGQMTCFDAQEKRTVIYRLQDVTVQGPHLHISRRVSPNQCAYYTPSFPYLNSIAQPRLDKESFNYQDLPLVQLDNVLVLHFLDNNYYHMTVEGLSKIVVSLNHPKLKGISNLQILSKPTQASVELFQSLGVIDRAVPYLGDRERYQIKNLYVIDYLFSPDILAPLLSASAGEPRIHFEDFYVPPTDVLQLTRSWLAATSIPGVREGPRDVVLFLHRKSGARSIEQPLSLYESLGYVSRLHGLNFFLHGVQDESLGEQISLFRRSVVVIGLHGAGLSNIIHAPVGTAVIELPVRPAKLSVYNRMASALGLPYYTTPETAFYHFHSIVEFTPRMVMDTTDTLLQALSDLGYQS